MQAIFDPSQGFFNALLFVVTSTEGRQNVFVAWAFLSRYWTSVLLRLCPCCSEIKKRCDSNMDSAEMTSGKVGDGFFNSLKGERGLQECLNTSVIDSTTMGPVSESQNHRPSDLYRLSEVRFDSSFSMDENAHRNSGDCRGDLDILTVPENVTVHTLVRNSLNTTYN